MLALPFISNLHAMAHSAFNNECSWAVKRPREHPYTVNGLRYS